MCSLRRSLTSRVSLINVPVSAGKVTVFYLWCLLSTWIGFKALPWLTTALNTSTSAWNFFINFSSGLSLISFLSFYNLLPPCLVLPSYIIEDSDEL